MIIIPQGQVQAATSWRPITAGIALSEHIEADGATVFRHACKLGCEGIVSKQRSLVLSLKNPASPAMTRVGER